MIKILIVEDQKMLRDSLCLSLNKDDGIKVIAVTDDASKAPALCREQKPDLVLMDVVTGQSNGIFFATQIRMEMPKIKIVIMTGFSDISFIDEARKAGAHSFLYKDSGHEHLLYIIHGTMKGISHYPSPEDISTPAIKLTEREISLIRLIYKGISRDEILKEMKVSEKTLKKIIKSILDKSGFDSIMRFAVYTAVNNLIAPANNL